MNSSFKTLTGATFFICLIGFAANSAQAANCYNACEKECEQYSSFMFRANCLFFCKKESSDHCTNLESKIKAMYDQFQKSDGGFTTGSPYGKAPDHGGSKKPEPK